MNEPTLQFFKYDHLPPHLKLISKPFCDLAHAIVLGDNQPHEVTGTVTIGGPLPRNTERTVALRKLLEAKDAAVRALIFQAVPTSEPTMVVSDQTIREIADRVLRSIADDTAGGLRV